MKKSERLEIEERVRLALSQRFSTEAESRRLAVGLNGPIHEFDIYSKDVVIGGVTTGTHKTTNGNSNTASRDRACAELLWLSLWPGDELRVYVFTDLELAVWLHSRFTKAPIHHKIDIYHFDGTSNAIFHVGRLGHSSTLHLTQSPQFPRPDFEIPPR